MTFKLDITLKMESKKRMGTKMGGKNLMPLVILLVTFALISSPIVMAMGVTSPYWDDRPLRMYPGETQNIQFELQNMIGDEDVQIRAEVAGGQEIAKITDKSKIYSVPLGTKDAKVNVRITVPKSAKAGDVIGVDLSFTTVANSKPGQLKLGSAFESKFSVVVTEKPAKLNTPAPSLPAPVGYAVAALAVVALLIAFSRRKVKKSRN